MRYRTKKYMATFVLLIVLVVVYVIAVPKGTPWVGKDSHLLNLCVGLLTGFVVLLVQFIVDSQRDREFEELLDTKITRVLSSRDRTDYYRALIVDARQEILVLGVTASRFLTDFADVKHSNDDHKVLIQALLRGVRVRFLLPAKAYLLPSEHKKFEDALARIAALRAAVVTQVDVRYYQHPPTVSMVVADRNCLVGPVFANKESRHTPTIHALREGVWAALHLDYFEEEWQIATSA